MVPITCLSSTFDFPHPVKHGGIAWCNGHVVSGHALSGHSLSAHALPSHSDPSVRLAWSTFLFIPYIPLFHIRAARLSSYTDRLSNWTSIFGTYLDTYYLLFSTNTFSTSICSLPGGIDQRRSYQMYPTLKSPWKLICTCFLIKWKSSPHLPLHSIEFLAIDVIQPLSLPGTGLNYFPVLRWTEGCPILFLLL